MKVSVVVVNWNGVEKLRRFLPEILKLRGVDEFVVTDDASTDGSVKLLERDFPSVRIIRRDKNKGFSSNSNSGVKGASGDLVFLLNSDAVPNIDCIEKALPYFNDDKIFSVGCNTGGNWSWGKFENGYFWHYVKEGEQETHQTLWSRGGSMILRKSIFEKLEGFDELFDPFYEEDTDLGYRATKSGYKNFWVKECVVKLPEEKGVIEKNFSKRKFSEVAQRNQLFFIWKNITDQDLIKDHKMELIKNIVKSPKYLNVFFMACRYLPQIRKKKKHQIKEFKLTDHEIFEMFKD